MAEYTAEWFKKKQDVNHLSAGTVVPYLRELFEPESVIDLGCGDGAWLDAFGLDDVWGVDGTKAPTFAERIWEKFELHDLSEGYATDRTFDMALSIEVAEHLPESAADAFVKSLTELAPVVVFSAAVPYQPGTGHVSLRWQPWWASVFRDHGYAAVDCLRLRFWEHPDVRYYHAQNMIVYVRRSELRRYGLEETAVPRLIHPKLYDYWVAQFPPVNRAKWRGFARFCARALHVSRK